MAKVRVYELAKEFGVESNVVLATLTVLPVTGMVVPFVSRGGSALVGHTGTMDTPVSRVALDATACSWRNSLAAPLGVSQGSVVKSISTLCW